MSIFSNYVSYSNRASDRGKGDGGRIMKDELLQNFTEEWDWLLNSNSCNKEGTS